METPLACFLTHMFTISTPNANARVSDAHVCHVRHKKTRAVRNNGAGREAGEAVASVKRKRGAGGQACCEVALRMMCR